MLLAVDVGNTQTVIGLFGDVDLERCRRAAAARRSCVDHWRIATMAERTSDELALLVQEFLGFHGFTFDDEVDGRGHLARSCPASPPRFRRDDRALLRVPPRRARARRARPACRSSTTTRRRSGADRIANAVAAFDLYGGPAIVIDFGTATTFDAVSANGEYLGGAIAPGIEISLDALFRRAAALRRVELVEPRSVIGRTTVESIQSGAVYGFAGQVDGIVDRMLDELGDARSIATGGLAATIAPYTRTIQHYEPWLTLHGLRLIFEKNQ